MKRLWKWIDEKQMSEGSKKSLFLFLHSLLFSALGFFLWLIASRFTVVTWEMAACFVGYAGFFPGYVGGFLFLCQQ